MSLAARIMLALIRAYQFTFSAFMGKQCRFYPSCSHYAAQAVRLHGARRGGWMGMRRILRCHPWNPGGYDPVPPLPAAGKFCSENNGSCATHAAQAIKTDAAPAGPHHASQPGATSAHIQERTQP